MNKQMEKDIYFMRFAKLASEITKCLSRPIGAVLVKDNHIIATGYNGPSSGLMHCGCRRDDGSYPPLYDTMGRLNKNQEEISDECPRRRMGFKSGEGMEHCPAVHAETNTICQAARMGIATEGATLYCYCNIPCTDCTKEIINAGIKEIVCLGYKESRPWVTLKATDMFAQAKVKIRTISKEIWNCVRS